MSDQLALPWVYPNLPGAAPIDTSIEAAKKIPDVELRRRKVMSLLRTWPHTTFEGAERLGYRVDQIQPRYAELHKMGLIEPSGEKRPSGRGGMATVWKAVE